MKEKIILLLKQATTHDQINEIVDTYVDILIHDNYLMDLLKAARDRANEKKEETVVWEIYELN